MNVLLNSWKIINYKYLKWLWCFLAYDEGELLKWNGSLDSSAGPIVEINCMSRCVATYNRKIFNFNDRLSSEWFLYNLMNFYISFYVLLFRGFYRIHILLLHTFILEKKKLYMKLYSRCLLYLIIYLCTMLQYSKPLLTWPN